MKIPVSPPDIDILYRELMERDRESLSRIISYNKPTDERGRYVHWDKLRFLEAPAGFSSELWWLAVKTTRRHLYRILPVDNYEMKPLRFALPDMILEELHWLDKNVLGTAGSDNPAMNTRMKNTYLMSSLIEESIRSSQLEGASTTRRVAKKMIQEGRKPRDKSEQMILNNFRAMQFIRDLTDEKLSPPMIRELHRILVDHTLSDESKVGSYREKNDAVYVVDEGNLVLFTPPDAGQIQNRIEEFCLFANEDLDVEYFIHPVIRSILLHFLLSYIHPFVDGNGRTARALFYWSMLKHGYWLTEFFSISKILREAPARYSYSFLYTESDENDMTYFIDYQLRVIRRAIDEFRIYIDGKTAELRKMDKILTQNTNLKTRLNPRQYSLLIHALKHPDFVYKIDEHRRIHGVAYDTARKDLLELADSLGLLQKQISGKSFNFTSPADLRERIEAAGEAPPAVFSGKS